MRITQETTSQKLKETMFENLNSIPRMDVIYPDDKTVPKTSEISFWINKLCNRHSGESMNQGSAH